MKTAKELLEGLNKLSINEDINDNIIQKEQEVKQILKDKFINILDTKDLGDLRSPEPGDEFQNYRNVFYNVANGFNLVKDYQEKMKKELNENPEEEKLIKEWYEPRILTALTEINKRIDELK